MARVASGTGQTSFQKARSRILAHLSQSGHYLMGDPLDDARMVLVAGNRQATQIRGSVPAAPVHALISDGAIVDVGGDGRRFALSEEGFSLAMRCAAGDEAEGFRQQHQNVRPSEQAVSGAVAVMLNDSESPLAWLRRRKNRDGTPMLDDVRFTAGERLRADLTRARTMPRVTANWTAAVATAGRGGAGLDPTDSMVAAQQRVQRALTAVGSDFAGVLIDVCGFLKGLADVERDRQWPARSGKVVLDLALGRLAEHYGLSAVAVGARRSRSALEVWTASDARPAMTDIHPKSLEAS